MNIPHKSLNHENFMDKLRYVVDATSSKVGGDYFNCLVQTLSETLDAEYVFIGEALDDFKRVRTLSFWTDDHFSPNFEYPIEGTPCETVLSNHVTFYPDGVQQSFPRDDDLVELNVKSYLAIPFFDSEGRANGHVCVMSRRPMQKNIYNEYLLEIISQRLSAEYLREKTEQKLVHLASHDVLTDLPNRVLFWDRLNTAIHRSERNQDKFGLIFLDLDNFKQLNDTYGHLVGDEFLMEIARRLRDFCRETDTLCRFGGDEFIVIAESADNQEDIAQFAYDIHYTLTCEDYTLQDVSIAARVSVGFAVFPDHATDAEQLLKKADMAMYTAKHGHNAVEAAV